MGGFRCVGRRERFRDLEEVREWMTLGGYLPTYLLTYTVFVRVKKVRYSVNQAKIERGGSYRKDQASPTGWKSLLSAGGFALLRSKQVASQQASPVGLHRRRFFDTLLLDTHDVRDWRALTLFFLSR
ncbi:hypothetical protein LY78DRAFT_437805 [Colletotrichum sublineola]|nr:hypothetical protein LY78DRAFT_437805 [Colletotrichum sublineola]